MSAIKPYRRKRAFQKPNAFKHEVDWFLAEIMKQDACSGYRRSNFHGRCSQGSANYGPQVTPSELKKICIFSNVLNAYFQQRLVKHKTFTLALKVKCFYNNATSSWTSWKCSELGYRRWPPPWKCTTDWIFVKAETREVVQLSSDSIWDTRWGVSTE